VKCGVYSSSSQWSAIFGSTSYSYGSNLPLWYAHYDNKASFSDYTKFGGWSSPHAKQYAGDTTECRSVPNLCVVCLFVYLFVYVYACFILFYFIF
jgi:hypothetical protein